jgi:hypothetical protein
MDKPTTFAETIKSFDAAKEAATQAEEVFKVSKAEWEILLAKRAALGNSDGSTMSRISGLIRRYGPKAATYYGLPGLSSLSTAAFMAPEGTFIGDSGVLSIIAQAFGW